MILSTPGKLMEKTQQFLSGLGMAIAGVLSWGVIAAFTDTHWLVLILGWTQILMFVFAAVAGIHKIRSGTEVAQGTGYLVGWGLLLIVWWTTSLPVWPHLQ